MSRTTLHLSKQNFKFSAAHFLIFDETRAEKLHGHNYQVKVDIEFGQNLDANPSGYYVDFNVFKSFIVKTLHAWDEMVLMPKNHPDMKFTEEGKSLRVQFRDRLYVFPKDEVVLMPVNNTSSENFSKLLSETFAKEFKQHGVSKIQVFVEETPGQGASTTVEL